MLLINILQFRGVAANDIALLKLSKSATLSPSVQLVEFGTEEDCNAIDTSVISGWGTTSGVFQNLPIHLRYANLPRITNNGIIIITHQLFTHIIC